LFTDQDLAEDLLKTCEAFAFIQVEVVYSDPRVFLQILVNLLIKFENDPF